MQNARISELEKVLAKSSSVPSPRGVKSSDLTSSEELNTMKEENRVVSKSYGVRLSLISRERRWSNSLFSFSQMSQLTEAMDVLQRQVDEYESEIRSLKDFKSPKSTQRRTSMSSRASPFMSPGFSASKGTPAGEALSEVSAATVGALEAALLRPALEAVRQDAARYKAQAMDAALRSLPPLDLMVTPASVGNEEFKQSGPANEVQSLATTLSQARSRVRMEKASFAVVDLSKTDKSPRESLLDSMARTYNAEMDLADAVTATERYLREKHGTVVSIGGKEGHLIGKVKLSGEEPPLIVPVTMTKSALNQLHNCMVR